MSALSHLQRRKRRRGGVAFALQQPKAELKPHSAPWKAVLVASDRYAGREHGSREL